MPRGVFVVNRVRPKPPWGDAPPSHDEAERSAAAHGLGLERGEAERLVTAHVEATRLAALDQRHLRKLTGDAVPIVRLPELASDVRDINALQAIADLLMLGGV